MKRTLCKFPNGISNVPIPAALLLAALLLPEPVWADGPTLVVADRENPASFRLLKDKAKTITLKVQNVSNADLPIGRIAFLADRNAPEEAAKVEVWGIQDEVLPKGATREIYVHFPAHAATGEYWGNLFYSTKDKPKENISPGFLNVHVRTRYLLTKGWAVSVALLLSAIFLTLSVTLKGKSKRNFFQSPDGAISISKVQVWLWTTVIVFSYAYLFLWNGVPDKFPDSIWQLMGISVVASGGAKYIAVTWGSGTKTTSEEVKQAIEKQFWLTSMLSDDGEFSLMRLQMFIWTVVAIVLFLLYVTRENKLWDIPQTLVILMGISQFGYLADKGAEAGRKTP